MEKLSCLFAALCISSMAFAQPQSLQVPGAPQWQVTLRVTDESGNPVAHANVFASYYIPPPQGVTEAGSQVTALTDTNGIAVLTAHSGPAIGYGASKDGYYTTGSIGYDFDFRNNTNGQWHPWNPTLNLVLKKVGKPIAMYAKRVEKGPPVFNEAVGYDLMIGDWVAPNGKGISTDIIFTGKLDRKAKNDFDYKLTISFPKADDGIQEFILLEAEKGSGLRSPHEAPISGYQPEVVKTMSHHPGQGAKDDMNDPNRNYFFRIRTVKDDNGNIVSAHYGKIYGDFMQFTYYLNPTPNDRNIEFDPKQNLFHGRDDSFKVSAP